MMDATYTSYCGNYMNIEINVTCKNTIYKLINNQSHTSRRSDSIIL